MVGCCRPILALPSVELLNNSFERTGKSTELHFIVGRLSQEQETIESSLETIYSIVIPHSSTVGIKGIIQLKD
ncbi:Uncharacterised protein [uncultured archaeon]|nr:Uncharacterised protein [uncultured archaeon]